MTLRYFIDANKKEWFSLKTISGMLRLEEDNVFQLANVIKEEHKQKVDVRQVALVCYGGLIPKELQQNHPLSGKGCLSSDDTRTNVYQWFVDEAGLYKIIMRSNSEVAEPFQDWVCEEVLPEIRKKGYYGSPLPKYIKRCSLNTDRIEQGYFSVIHELSIILGLRVEDPHHIIMQDKAPDGKDICPDISVGILFSTYLKKNYPEYVGCFKFYTHKYPDGREVPARQYDNKLLGIFREYVELFWLKDRAPKYFSDKDPKIAEVLQKQLK